MGKLRTTAIILGIFIILEIFISKWFIGETPISRIPNTIITILTLIMLGILFLNKNEMINGVVILIASLIGISSKLMLGGGVISLMFFSPVFILEHLLLVILLFVGYKLITSEKKRLLLIGIIGILITSFIYSLYFVRSSLSGEQFKIIYPILAVSFSVVFLVVIMIGITRIIKEKYKRA